MGTEIEAKMRLTDIPGLQARLVERGAKQEGQVLEINTYFDTPDGSLRESDQGLRVRIEKDVNGAHENIVVTHKGPREPGPLKTRPETEINVPDADDITRLLSALGFNPVLTFEKRRQTWELGDCEVVIDTVPYLGDYVEIEGPSQEVVLATRQELKLGELPLIQTGYIGMLMDHLREHGIDDRDIRFQS